MKKVAFFAFGIGDISGGGGYERFFSDFFADYIKDKERKYELLLVTDDLEGFKRSGKLLDIDNRAVQFVDYRYKLYFDLTDKVILLKHFFRFYRTLYTQLAFLKLLYKNKVDILHLPNYLSTYFFLLKFISKTGFITGIKTAITVVDCSIPALYNSTEEHYIKTGSTSHTYKPLFKKVKLNGIFTWYKSFKDFVIKNKLVSDYTKVYPVRSRYVNYSGGVIPFSEKEDQMVFAGRLDDRKRPIVLLKAIKLALEKNSKILAGWQFKVYGKGVLENELRAFINDNKLNRHIEVTFSSDMKQVFKDSKCLVSTQEFENFPSMSIYEAMVTGNAIIAFNVGQTAEFVKDGENGIIVMEESERALCDAILNYVSKPELQQVYYKNNIKLCSESHTYPNFRRQIEEFWDSL